MHKSQLGALVIDCRTDDLFREAEFWGAALGCAVERPEDQRNPRYVRLQGRTGEVQVILQQVDHSSRVHIDIESDDIEAEVRRLQDLGASIVTRLEQWVVMEAPSGHRYCVIGPVRDGFEDDANGWD